jgi:hypothetical protein
MEYRRFVVTYRPYHARSTGLSANKQSKRTARRLLTAYPEDERYNSKRRNVGNGPPDSVTAQESMYKCSISYALTHFL